MSMKLLAMFHQNPPHTLDQILAKHIPTRAVLVFATERKNNVDPRLRSQKKVKNVQLFFAKLQLGHSDLVFEKLVKGHFELPYATTMLK